MDTKPRLTTTSTDSPTGATTSVLATGVVVRSVALVHTDAPGITGGREMLVWVVKLGEMTERGEMIATVYVDALTGEVLTWTTAG